MPTLMARDLDTVAEEINPRDVEQDVEGIDASIASEGTSAAENLINEFFEVNLNMNDAQFKAVTLPIGSHVQIIAGPGTGKTTTLVYRVLYLISQGISPNDILVTTLTNRATMAFREKIQQVAGVDIAQQLCVQTLHSFCQSLLAEYGSGVDLKSTWFLTDNWDQKSVMEVSNATAT